MSKPRYEYEPEYELEKGCRCLSCYERTGKWLVQDMLDLEEDLVYDTEDEAREVCERKNHEHESNSKG